MLGVSQTDLEHGYYMVDLTELLKAKRKHDALHRLADVHMFIATSGRSIEEADYKTYIRGLSDSVGVKQDEKFSREKFEELRMFAK